MNQVLFFQNVRQDGGVHVGFAVNDTIVFEDYRIDSDSPDPALLWYVDLECSCDVIPEYPEHVRDWFLRNEPEIDRLLAALGEKLELGADADVVPFSIEKRTPAHSAGEVVIRVTGSALRRIRATEIARNLTELKETWADKLRSLPAVSPALSG